jgi:hypothetical protein
MAAVGAVFPGTSARVARKEIRSDMPMKNRRQDTDKKQHLPSGLDPSDVEPILKKCYDSVPCDNQALEEEK